MIGTITGDVVGSRFEFNNIKTKDFELFTKDCSFTDDTICTIAIADAIYRRIDYKDALLEWCRKDPNPKGSYGLSFEHGWRNDNPQPYNSYGNGSAMRVSQIGPSYKRFFSCAFPEPQKVKKISPDANDRKKTDRLKEKKKPIKQAFNQVETKKSSPSFGRACH